MEHHVERVLHVFVRAVVAARNRVSDGKRDGNAKNSDGNAPGANEEKSGNGTGLARVLLEGLLLKDKLNRTEDLGNDDKAKKCLGDGMAAAFAAKNSGGADNGKTNNRKDNTENVVECGNALEEEPEISVVKYLNFYRFYNPSCDR